MGPAHAPVACAGCHVKHDEVPHPEGLPKPECVNCHKTKAADLSQSVHGMAARAGKTAPDCETCHNSAHDAAKPGTFEFFKGVKETCESCHGDIAEQFEASVHGRLSSQGVVDAPTCMSCHGEHKILAPNDKASTVNPSHIRETCGQCHGDVKLSQRLNGTINRVASFDESFHGLALKGGSQTAANCASCHGVHNILPSADPKSKIHAKNIAKTCGSCHPGAGSSFAITTVHTAQGKAEPEVVAWVRWFYMILIPLLLGLMFIHNLGDWIRKLIRLRRGGSKTPQHAVTNGNGMRMYPTERIQHALLALSFIILTWSGFALKWPNEWWAVPLTMFEEVGVRRNIHRGAAVLFIVVSFAHLFTLLFNKDLRRHWKSLLPKWSDIGLAMQGFAYNIGLRKTPPNLPSHSYIEKAEYWAVVWGAVLMSVTGLLLWANDIVLQYLPKSWLDVATAIHWYEAVLAAAAIAIWHFYSVIFDPDVYPLDTAFLTGQSARKDHGVATPNETETGPTSTMPATRAAEPDSNRGDDTSPSLITE
jgi:cytochrome b subunit of formate dehydrogenase